MKNFRSLFKGSLGLRWFWFAALTGYAISLCVACRTPTLNQLNYTRQEPNKSDLVGTWVPDQASLRTMGAKGGYDTSVQPKLVLKSDGTFELLNMPDWWSSRFGESGKAFESYSGSWTVSKFSKVWAVALRPVASGTRFLNLIGQSPPYQIDFIIGDADENNSMIFNRL